MSLVRAWLIGAGPGDVDLITVKAVKALAQADVVLVDDLVNPDILAYANDKATILHVGKRGGRASVSQDDIGRLMLDHLRAGQRVARLKGGDPFVFGRGGEELQVLREAGIDVEVINGITAGIAAPSMIGIPVTHRDHAQGVIFVTGYSAAEQTPNWPALVATRMTLVIYMGMSRLDQITNELLAAGMNPATPCAIVQSATRLDQRHALCTLGELVEVVEREAFGSPSIVVVGDVVGSQAATPGGDA